MRWNATSNSLRPLNQDAKQALKSGVSFVQIFPAENQQCLFEAMRNIFEYIGFVPRKILFDNASQDRQMRTHLGKGMPIFRF